MNKVLILLLNLLLVLTFANADIVMTKNGEAYSGTITEQAEDHVKLDTRYGAVTILRSDIESLDITGNSLKHDERKIEKMNSKASGYEFGSKQFLFKQYKTGIGLALGFGVPGIIITTTAFSLGTPLLIMECVFNGAYNYNKDNGKYYPNQTFFYGLGWYAGCLSIGFCFDAIALVASYYASKYFKQLSLLPDRVSMIMDVDPQKSLSLGFCVKL